MRYPRTLLLAVLPAAFLAPAAEGQVQADPDPGPETPVTLLEAVALAMDHHPEMEGARARVDVAEGVLNQARGARFPSLLTEASVVRHQEPMLVAPLHGFDPTMAPTFDRNLVRGNLALRYSVFDGGDRGARIDRAEAGRGRALEGERMTRMELSARVSRVYLELLSTVDLLAAAKSQREALEAEEDRVLQFLEVGKAAQVELLRVEAALSRSQADLISLESSLEVTRGTLARLTGLEVEEIRGRGVSRVRLGPGWDPPISEIMGSAKAENPELALARRELGMAAAQVTMARADWLPSIQVAGAYTNFGSLDGGHTREWQGSLQISYPLFTGGAREAELDRAAAEERRAAEALRAVELEVENAVEEGVAAVVEARALREALERGVRRAEEVSRIEALALEVGSGVQSEYLRSQADLFQARASLAQAVHGEVMAAIRLARVSGHLTLSWFQETMEVVR